jgi:hypothetical protein
MMEQFEPKVANKYRMALLAPELPDERLWLQSISASVAPRKLRPPFSPVGQC